MHSGNCVELRGKCETLISMCVALLAGAVEGFCRIFKRILQGRPRGEKGLKAVRKDVIVETGIDIFAVWSRFEFLGLMYSVCLII